MDQDLQTQLSLRMAELPPDVRETIQAPEFGEKIRAIGTKHQLHIDQIGAIEDEVLLVLMAFTDPSDFVSNLESQIHVDNALANTLADEIAKEILFPIRESMQMFMEAHQAKSILATANEDFDGPLAVQNNQAPLAPQQSSLKVSSQQSPLTPPAPAYPGADLVLTEKTVTVPQTPDPQTAAKPPVTRKYSQDPYHEPVE